MTSMKRNGTELRDTHRLVLSSAAQREDGLLVLPDRIKGAVARQVLGKLHQRGLIKQFPIGGEQPSGGMDVAGPRSGFVVTDAGRLAVGVKTQSPLPPRVSDGGSERPCRLGEANAIPVAVSRKPIHTPREGSKQALILGLLNRPGGASLGDLVSATGWLPHTTQAALTRLRQGGYNIERRKAPEGTTAYSVQTGPALVEASRSSAAV